MGFGFGVSYLSFFSKTIENFPDRKQCITTYLTRAIERYGDHFMKYFASRDYRRTKLKLDWIF